MRTVTRRGFLQYSGATAIALLGGVNPLLATERETGVREIVLDAGVSDIDLGGGRTFKAMAYNGVTPGPEIRLKEGERLRVTLHNNLSEETTIHWHGMLVPNSMGGAPDVTRKAVPPGGTSLYDFVASMPGTYLYHSHASYQLDQGLYGALIVEPGREELSYDREYSILLEDWAMLDGAGPAASRQGRIRIMSMRGMAMNMAGMRQELHSEGHPLREPLYDAYTMNGKIFEAGNPLKVKKGEQLRLRIMNASSSTIYTVRVAGHSLTITHADGRPVQPLEVDALRIGMGERYDVLLHAVNPGRWLIYNLKDDTPVGGRSLGVLLYDGVESRNFNPDSLSGIRLNEYERMEGIPESFDKQAGRHADKELQMVLDGGVMGNPYWSINGNVYPDSRDIFVTHGDRVRLNYVNRTMMAHPMHLHGHFFEIVSSGRKTGVRVRKDTLIIPPDMGRGAVEFIAGNPGSWLHHCQHLYHFAAGMANLVRVS